MFERPMLGAVDVAPGDAVAEFLNQSTGVWKKMEPSCVARQKRQFLPGGFVGSLERGDEIGRDVLGEWAKTRAVRAGSPIRGAASNEPDVRFPPSRRADTPERSQNKIGVSAWPGSGLYREAREGALLETPETGIEVIGIGIEAPRGSKGSSRRRSRAKTVSECSRLRTMSCSSRGPCSALAGDASDASVSTMAW